MFNDLITKRIIDEFNIYENDIESVKGELAGSVLFSKTLLNAIGDLYNKNKSRNESVAEGTVTLWDIIEKYIPSITNDCDSEMKGAKAKYLLHLIVKLYVDYYKSNPSYINSNELISEDARKYVEAQAPNCELFKQMCSKTRWNTIRIDVYLDFVIKRWSNKTTKKFGAPIQPSDSQNRAKALLKFGVPIIIPSLHDSYERNLENWIAKNSEPHKDADGKKGKYQGEEQKQLKHDLICALENEYHCFTKNILGQTIPLEQTLKLIANFRYEAHSSSEATMLYMRSLEDVTFVSAIVQQIPLPYDQYLKNLRVLETAYFNTIVGDARKNIESSYANIRSAFSNVNLEIVKEKIKIPFSEKTLNRIGEICGKNVLKKRTDSFYEEIAKIVEVIPTLDTATFCDKYISRLKLANNPMSLLVTMYREVLIAKDKIHAECDQFINDVFELSIKHGLKFKSTAKDKIKEIKKQTIHFCGYIIKKAVYSVVAMQETGIDDTNTITVTVTQELCNKLGSILDIEKYVKEHVYYFCCLKHQSIYNAVAKHTSVYFDKYSYNSCYNSDEEENAEMRLFNYMRDLIYNTMTFGASDTSLEVYKDKKYTEEIISQYNNCINLVEDLQSSLGFDNGTPETFKEPALDSDHIYYTHNLQSRIYITKHKFDAQKDNMFIIRNLLIAFCFETSDTLTIKQINGILEDCGFAPLYTKYDAIKSKLFDWLVVQAVVLCSNRTIKKKVCEEMFEINRFYLLEHGEDICI